MGEEAVEIATDIHNAQDYADAMDIVGASASLVPGFSWVGEAAAGVGKKGIGYIQDYNKRLAKAIDDIDSYTSIINDTDPSTSVINDINPSAGTSFTAAQRFVPRRDPLILDLNGNGIETVPVSATNPIMFDHEGNGIKNGTGWIAPSDGFLVLDRNGNGTIDDGTELFGDNTPLYGDTLDADGQTVQGIISKAADGFDALAQQDTNGDGIVRT